MTADDFRAGLVAILARGQRQGRPHVEVNAGEFHRVMGGYPARGDHRMPVVCQLMREQQRPGDEIVFEPPGGAGASLTIRYNLPR